MSLFTSCISRPPLAGEFVSVLFSDAQFPPLSPWWKSRLGRYQALYKEVARNDEIKEVETAGKTNKKLMRAKLQEFKSETMGE